MATFFPPSFKSSPGAIAPHSIRFDLFAPLRYWLDHVVIQSDRQAHIICRLIPCDCPFERDITLFGRKLFHIPPLCKLNPLYLECVSLRLRALTYLAEERGEDVTQYIC